VQETEQEYRQVGVDRQELAQVFAKWGIQPELDYKAISSSSICKQFFAKGQCSAAAGQDFFAQKLEPGPVYYCCSPVKEAYRAAKRLVAEKGVESILVVPQ
jgi:hypothetical protein